MATHDPNLDMWKARTGAYFATQEEAEAEDAAMLSGGQTSTDQDIARNGWDGGINVLGNDIGSHISADRATRSNDLFSGGLIDLNRDGYIDDQDQTLSEIPLGTRAEEGGTATTHQTVAPGVGTVNTSTGKRNVPLESASVVTPGSGTDTTGDNGTAAAQDTADAKSEAQSTIDENEAQNENLFAGVYNKLNQLGGGDYGMSDEARGYQKEGLQQQRMLLEKALGFDPNQYATKFADQALARQVAAGRSAGTSAAAQQAGMFGAMEQAPALYAEGARQAESVAANRLSLAESAAKSFGELGTATRSSDENRQQFESSLQLEIGQAFTDAVQGKMQMNEAESGRMTEVWMNFAQLQSVYDKMSFEEQEAALDRMMQDKQLDQQWKMFKEQLKADGKVSAKDIVGGLFSLGGGAIGALGAIGAAGAGKK